MKCVWWCNGVERVEIDCLQNEDEKCTKKTSNKKIDETLIWRKKLLAVLCEEISCYNLTES